MSTEAVLVNLVEQVKTLTETIQRLEANLAAKDKEIALLRSSHAPKAQEDGEIIPTTQDARKILILEVIAALKDSGMLPSSRRRADPNTPPAPGLRFLRPLREALAQLAMPAPSAPFPAAPQPLTTLVGLFSVTSTHWPFLLTWFKGKLTQAAWKVMLASIVPIACILLRRSGPVKKDAVLRDFPEDVVRDAVLKAGQQRLTRKRLFLD
ncbi:hypothetical protein BC829DRAFT_413672 [Chytridium lagenaria]|nr:hypothetical protein BC829DRAFT_413672 [Chytridium lagenaria]